MLWVLLFSFFHHSAIYDVQGWLGTVTIQLPNYFSFFNLYAYIWTCLVASHTIGCFHFLIDVKASFNGLQKNQSFFWDFLLCEEFIFEIGKKIQLGLVVKWAQKTKISVLLLPGSHDRSTLHISLYKATISFSFSTFLPLFLYTTKKWREKKKKKIDIRHVFLEERPAGQTLGG